MNRESPQHGQPDVQLVSLGQDGHGKTTLTAAITNVLADRVEGNFAWRVAELDLPMEMPERGIRLDMFHIEIKTEDRSYVNVGEPGPVGLTKIVLAGAASLDCAILVVAVDQGPTSQTVEHLVAARRVGVPSIVVALTKADTVADKKLESTTSEVRELLRDSGYPGDDVPIVPVSALQALEGDADAADSVMELLRQLDSYIPDAANPFQQPFLMPIVDVFPITGGGSVVTGTVEQGTVKTGDELQLVGLSLDQKVTCTGIEMLQAAGLPPDQRPNGTGVLLGGIETDELQSGQVLAEPGSISAHTAFDALVYMLATEEGGRQEPFSGGDRPQFLFWGSEWVGEFTSPDGAEPGEIAELAVALMSPIALKTGLLFAIREGDRTVGVGRVIRLHK